MKVIIPVLLIFLLLSCNDDNGSNGEDCLEPTDIANTDCAASDVLLLCGSFFCGVNFPPGTDTDIAIDIFFPPFDRSSCEVIDCNTLDCGDSGLFADLQIDEFGGPSGTILDILGTDATFTSCTLFQ